MFDIADDAAENVLYTYPFDVDSADENVKQFIKKYFEIYKRNPETLAANSYDTVKIIVPIMKKCGDDTDCTRDELYNTKNYPGVGGLISFDENGDVDKPLIIKTVRDGEFVKY